MPFIEVNNISKSYDSNKALFETTFNIEKNEIFGLIGPDGSGKSTLFRILTTLILPDTGFAKISNFDIVKNYKEIRKIVGYMPGKFSLYQDLTVEENLDFFATIFETNIKENYNLIKDIYIQIVPFKNRLAGNLSGGMKQKLALSCALIHKPQVLILDEPTTGVDALSRTEFWGLLKNLQKIGITIIVSTPYMDEANLCNRIALIQQGKIMKIDTPEKTINSFENKIYSVYYNNVYILYKTLQNFRKDCEPYLFGQVVHLSCPVFTEAIEIENYLKSENLTTSIITEMKPTIEDCFLKLMKSPL